MAVTNDDLARVRAELESKIGGVSVEHVHLVQAIGSYGERFTAVDRQFEAAGYRMDALSADMDRRFDAMSSDMDRRFDAMSSEMDRRFDAMSSEMDRRFGAVDVRFGEISSEADRRFSDVRSDIARLDGRIDRLDAKLDMRFNVQTVLMTALGILVLFDDAIRELLGF